jgi:hypothetical protein
VRIVGKGGKQRHCPLWRVTVAELTKGVGQNYRFTILSLRDRGLIDGDMV